MVLYVYIVTLCSVTASCNDLSVSVTESCYSGVSVTVPWYKQMLQYYVLCNVVTVPLIEL